jgi:hypothetical protein
MGSNPLWDAERALQTLETFENSDQFDPILQDQLTKLRNRIISEVDFIRHRPDPDFPGTSTLAPGSIRGQWTQTRLIRKDATVAKTC